MCNECVKIASEIDPKLLAIMEEIKDDMAALHAKIAPQMREVLQMLVVNVETGEEPEGLPAEEMAEINEMQNKIAGIIGLAYAASWTSIRMIPDQKEALMMGSSIMSFAHKGAEEAMAYDYVVNRVKH